MNEVNLYQGDCLKVMDKLIEKDIKVDAIITDPPYGTTACKWDSVIPFDEMWPRLKALRKERTPIVLFGSEPFSSHLRMSNIKEYKYDWIWKKTNPTGFLNARRMPLKNYENVMIFHKNRYYPQKTCGKPYIIKRGGCSNSTTADKKIQAGGYITKNNGDRFPLQVQEFKNGKKGLHPTQKPIALLEYIIKTYTQEGDIVLDFTMGSGTAGVACRKLNRKFIGIESDEKAFDIAMSRIYEKT